VRSYAEQALWLLWSRSGDREIDALMARGVEEMQAGRHAGAIAAFSAVISRKPDFAGDWNKRATVYYLAGEHRKSLADCEQVLKRNPRHFGALSGAGMVGVELELLRLQERLKARPKLST
jgi:tetratricopeptide (TPR) repeat protein